MGKLYGISSTDIIPQSDFAARQNENGGWMATQSFIIRKGGIDNQTIRNVFSGGVTLTSLDPNADFFFEFLRLVSVPTIETIEGGWTKVSVEFAGFTSNGYETPDGGTPEPTPRPTYSLRATTIEKPFSEHSKWKALTEEQKVTLGRIMDGSVIYKASGAYGSGLYWNSETGSYLPAGEQITDGSGDAYEFALRIQQGRSTYPVGTFEWTKRWESSSGIQAAALNKLGKIATPPGSPPTPTGERDWMLIGANQEQYGDGEYRFQNELVFILSDAGGHDLFLHDT